MKEISLVYPHQLFEKHPALKKGRDVLIIEDPLFFGDYYYPLNFHKMKLTFHRSSMKAYESELKNKNFNIRYFEYGEISSGVSNLFKWLKKNGYGVLHYVEPDDYILNKRINIGADKYGFKLAKYENPSFLNNHDYLRDYFSSKKSYFQHYFYIDQRKKFELLVDNGSPKNGKWSFDAENRKTIPKDLNIPELDLPENDKKLMIEAKEYIDRTFPDNPGSNDNFYLPFNSELSKRWLKDFLEIKFINFGQYQDAILKEKSFLFHSLLSPLLNSGLITPDYVISETIKFVENNQIPLNSTEGFIRQIVGWREFIRAVYLLEGVKQRNSNYWGNTRKIPESFYTGNTGILPVDMTIKKLLKTGYNHHIERLMILGNFMLLCEFEPTEIYNWFMEMYVDAYDWVMVPNVYGMSQFADGGLMSTKPYISSSNYIRKMSDFDKGGWTEIWDALFWNFIHKHNKYFGSNNRTVFISRNLEKMPRSKLKKQINTAQKFLNSLK